MASVKQNQYTNASGTNPILASLYFDGCSLMNPGKGGAGAVIVTPSKTHKFTKYLGDNITNNVAEYQGLILGLESALNLNITTLDVMGDSQLVIYQVLGKYACKDSKLVPLYNTVKKLGSRFKIIHFNWIRREENSLADKASREAISLKKTI